MNLASKVVLEERGRLLLGTAVLALGMLVAAHQPVRAQEQAGGGQGPSGAQVPSQLPGEATSTLEDEPVILRAPAPDARRVYVSDPADFAVTNQIFAIDGNAGKLLTVTDGGLVVTLDEVRRAMKLMAEKARVVAEGAGALPLAAALTGKAGNGPIVCVVSGGNVDLKKFCELIDV